MLGYRKFGAVLYFSTTLAAAAVVGFALFIGFAPSNINLFSKNRDVRDWLFITAASSLLYITLSVFAMFYLLTGRSTKKLDSNSKYASTRISGTYVDTDSITYNPQQKNKAIDISSPLFRSSNIINELLVNSAVSDKQDNNLSCNKLQCTKKDKDIVRVNMRYFDDQYNQEGSLSSSIYGYIPSSQLYLNHEMDRKDSNKSKVTDKGLEQKCLQMYVPEHIYLDICL